jgi:hypothetical protein
MTSAAAEGLAKGLLDFIERQRNQKAAPDQAPARLN